MQKHFLATISNEGDHLFGVRFICAFFNQISDSRVTLLHIYKSEGNKTAVTSIWDKPGEETPAPISLQANKTVKKALHLLGEYNMPVDHVLTKTVSEKYGKVKDILIESAKGHYDAIVLGRRVSYTLQWMFERPSDETFQTMIKEHTCVSPLWICPDVDPGRKNILLCIDGSESGYRAVDHVGYILSTQKQHSITLLHVENTVGTECVNFFKRAGSILKNHNIEAKRIKQTVIWGLSASATISNEAKKGKYAAVALGMGGQKKDKTSGIMRGSTTAKLIRKLEKTSLWCCP